jgi:hypothetical protein
MFGLIINCKQLLLFKKYKLQGAYVHFQSTMNHDPGFSPPPFHSSLDASLAAFAFLSFRT